MEEVEVELELGETPNINIKEIYVNEDDNKYKCLIQVIKEFLHVSLYDNNVLKYKGYLHISNIQNSLGIYNFNIDDIFNEVRDLNNDKFNLIKDINKYQLKIEFKILNKKRNINIDLNENDNQNIKNNDFIKTINELKEIIKMKDNRIQLLEEELNKYKSYENFNIALKEPKYIIKNHTGPIRCSTVLKDGRLVTGSDDKSIIIYNKETFKPDLIINEHQDIIKCIIQLDSGELASCSKDATIKLYQIKENEYNVLQTLKEHNDKVNKIIELKNGKLVSCSWDKSIIFYNKINNEYKKEFSFTTNGPNGPIIQTEVNEICYCDSENNKRNIYFYDFIGNKIINKINNINISGYCVDCLLMISKNLLLITGINQLSIVNVSSHTLIRTLDISDSGYIYSSSMINKNMLLTGDQNKRIIQWKIEDNNLTMISKRENAHDNKIYTIKIFGNGNVLSGGNDNLAKIW